MHFSVFAMNQLKCFDLHICLKGSMNQMMSYGMDLNKINGTTF